MYTRGFEKKVCWIESSRINEPELFIETMKPKVIDGRDEMTLSIASIPVVIAKHVLKDAERK